MGKRRVPARDVVALNQARLEGLLEAATSLRATWAI